MLSIPYVYFYDSFHLQLLEMLAGMNYMFLFWTLLMVISVLFPLVLAKLLSCVMRFVLDQKYYC